MTFRESECFFGKCLVISTQSVEIAVTLDVGPRIISLSKKNGSNIFFNDIKDEINKDVSAIFGKGEQWHIYGGHRIWLSPEAEHTYIPDNQHVEYKIKDNRAVFYPAVWEQREIATRLEIEVVEDSLFKIEMYAKNISATTATFGLWGLTVCRAGGNLEIALPLEDMGYLPNRNLVFWSYSDINDSRLHINNEKLTIRGSILAPSPLKVGTFNQNVYCAFYLDDTVFIKQAYLPQGIYPDMGCNIECYTNNLMQEVEVLSPIKSVASGEEISLSEFWRII